MMAASNIIILVIIGTIFILALVKVYEADKKLDSRPWQQYPKPTKEAAENEAPEIKPDAVHHPTHYCRGGLECIEAIKAATTGLGGYEAYCLGNALKYLWRYKFKNGREDLEKAKVYINYINDYLESQK